jgi:class 3 adenylate cyclase/tetratricopeptide (TPR) repeat protein
VNPLVPDFITQRNAEGQTSGTIEAAALFVDISGFTSLTTKLMQHGRGGREGAEALVRTLRFHFDPLVAAVHEAGGFITGFAGDAFTALFPFMGPIPPRPGSLPFPPATIQPPRPTPAPRALPLPGRSVATGERLAPVPLPPRPTARLGTPPPPTFVSRHNVAQDALIAAERMQRFFADNPVYDTPYGEYPFSMRVGLSFGKVSFWIVRVAAVRAFYFFHGPAIDAAAAIEHHAQAGDVLFDAAFRERIPAVDATPMGQGLFMALPSGSVNELPPASQVAPAPESGLFVAPGITGVPPQGEFREVASVFAGFENVSDPPELIRLLDDLSSRYGGTFTGLDSGDKGINCLIHFGAPVSHENDTERALDFVLELRRALEPITRLRAGVSRGIRYVGFNGGTRRMEFACLGRATNLAARLMMSAPWGEIYCGPGMITDAQSTYQMEERSALTLKGFEQPVNAAALIRKKQIGVQKEFHAKELIGRQAELERLARVVDPIFPTETTPGRFVGVVYIDGEAGIGKSFLIETYRQVLEGRNQPFLWIVAPCDQTLRISLNPFEAAFKAYCRIEDGGSKEEKRIRLDEAIDRMLAGIPEQEVALKRELDEARSLFGAMIGVHWGASLWERLDPKARFDRTLSALFTWLRAEGLQKPVILQIEDAHWADDETRRALQVIARAAATGNRPLPLAMICTARNRDDGAPCRLDLDRAVPRVEIALGPLSPDDIAKIAMRMMGRPIHDIFRSLLLEHAGGNPFFAEEILTYWGESETDGVSTELSYTASSVALLPSDVNSLLVARLDRLAAPLKLTVFAAAVLGVEFDLRVLGLMFDGHFAEVAEQTRAIEKQRIWLQISPIRYRFRNTLLRNAAYEIQARARLQRLHLKAALAIEAVHSSDIDVHLAELARHYRRAEATEKARHYLLRAARQATSRYAHAQARQLYRAYLKVAGDPPTPESVVVRYELARDVLEPGGALAKAWDEYGQVIEEAQQIASRGSEALGWLGRGRVRFSANQHEDAVTCLEQALEICRSIDNRWTERRTLSHLALALRALGRHQEAASIFEQSLLLARDLGEHNESTTFSDVLRRYLVDGRVDVALEVFDQTMLPGVKSA